VAFFRVHRVPVRQSLQGVATMRSPTISKSHAGPASRMPIAYKTLDFEKCMATSESAQSTPRQPEARMIASRDSRMHLPPLYSGRGWKGIANPLAVSPEGFTASFFAATRGDGHALGFDELVSARGGAYATGDFLFGRKTPAGLLWCRIFNSVAVSSLYPQCLSRDSRSCLEA